MHQDKRGEALDKVLLDKVSRVLDENDPYDIIYVCTTNGFAYEDVAGEYETEARAILLRRDEWEDVWELEAVIKDVFDQFFYNPNISDARYTQTARAIWDTVLVHLGQEPEDYMDEIEPPPRTEYVTIRLE